MCFRQQQLPAFRRYSYILLKRMLLWVSLFACPLVTPRKIVVLQANASL